MTTKSSDTQPKSRSTSQDADQGYGRGGAQKDPPAYHMDSAYFDHRWSAPPSASQSTHHYRLPANDYTPPYYPDPRNEGRGSFHPAHRSDVYPEPRIDWPPPSWQHYNYQQPSAQYEPPFLPRSGTLATSGALASASSSTSYGGSSASLYSSPNLSHTPPQPSNTPPYNPRPRYNDSYHNSSAPYSHGSASGSSLLSDPKKPPPFKSEFSRNGSESSSHFSDPHPRQYHTYNNNNNNQNTSQNNHSSHNYNAYNSSSQNTHHNHNKPSSSYPSSTSNYPSANKNNNNNTNNTTTTNNDYNDPERNRVIMPLMRRSDSAPETYPNEAAKWAAELFWACGENKLEPIQEALKHVKVLDFSRNGCESPLYRAAMTSNITAMELLIKAKANLNYQDHRGNTALHAAVSAASTSSFTFLVKVGADTHLKNDYKDTPLEEARFLAKKGKIPQDYVRAIEDIINQAGEGIELYSRSSLSEFIKAAGAGDLEYVMKEQKAGIHIDGMCNGVTALSQAAFFGRLDVIKFLIEAKANVNSAAQMKGRTALHSAVDGSKSESFTLLIESGANASIKNIYGCNPFDEMIRNKEFSHQQVAALFQYAKEKGSIDDSVPFPTLSQPNRSQSSNSHSHIKTELQDDQNPHHQNSNHRSYASFRNPSNQYPPSSEALKRSKLENNN